MGRNLETDMANATGGAVFRPLVFVELDFPDGYFRSWNGYQQTSWDGKTWEAGGDVLSISPVRETADIRANGVTLSVSGISSEWAGYALEQNYQGRTARIWLGALDDGGSVVADPYLIFQGRMDQMTISDGGEEMAISLTVESRLIELNKARERRYNHFDQQIDHPGDDFFIFTEQIKDKPIYWGRAAPA